MKRLLDKTWAKLTSFFLTLLFSLPLGLLIAFALRWQVW